MTRKRPEERIVPIKKGQVFWYFKTQDEYQEDLAYCSQTIHSLYKASKIGNSVFRQEGWAYIIQTSNIEWPKEETFWEKPTYLVKALTNDHNNIPRIVMFRHVTSPGARNTLW